MQCNARYVAAMVIGVCRLISSLALARSSSALLPSYPIVLVIFLIFLRQHENAARAALKPSSSLNQSRLANRHHLHLHSTSTDQQIHSYNETADCITTTMIIRLLRSVSRRSMYFISLSLTLLCLTTFATFSHLVHSLPKEGSSRWVTLS